MNTKRLNVGLMCSSLSGGGAERVVSILSQELSNKYNVYLLLFDGTRISYSYKGTLIDLGLEEKQMKWNDRFPKWRRFATLASFVELSRILKKKKKEIKLDVCISFLETANILNILSRNKEKCIVSVRSTRSIQNRSFYERIENKGIRLYKKADAVISISDGVKFDLITNFGLSESLIKTIYNPYDVSMINSKMNEPLSQSEQHFYDDSDILVSVGRLIPQKNHERLIKSLPLLLDKYPRMKIVLIGSGECKDKLASLVRELNIEEKVMMIPFNDNPFKYVAKSLMFISSSEREGLGNVIIEAMIAHIPVIAVDCLSGPKEIIAGESNYSKLNTHNQYCKRGILAPLEEYDKNGVEYCKAIERIMEDKKYRDEIINNANAFVDSLSIRKIIGQWEDVIEKGLL